MAAEQLSSIRSGLDSRLDELRPAVSEYQHLLAAAVALGAVQDRPVSTRAASRTSRRSSATRRPRRAPRGDAQKAIIAALEHGSHSARELVGVTALSSANIRANLRRLTHEGVITRTTREGRGVYALK